MIRPFWTIRHAKCLQNVLQSLTTARRRAREPGSSVSRQHSWSMASQVTMLETSQPTRGDSSSAISCYTVHHDTAGPPGHRRHGSYGPCPLCCRCRLLRQHYRISNKKSARRTEHESRHHHITVPAAPNITTALATTPNHRSRAASTTCPHDPSIILVWPHTASTLAAASRRVGRGLSAPSAALAVHATLPYHMHCRTVKSTVPDCRQPANTSATMHARTAC